MLTAAALSNRPRRSEHAGLPATPSSSPGRARAEPLRRAPDAKNAVACGRGGWGVVTMKIQKLDPRVPGTAPGAGGHEGSRMGREFGGGGAGEVSKEGTRGAYLGVAARESPGARAREGRTARPRLPVHPWDPWALRATSGALLPAAPFELGRLSMAAWARGGRAGCVGTCGAARTEALLRAAPRLKLDVAPTPADVGECITCLHAT